MTVRRMKTYTGQTGYVYQYYFVGKRAAANNEPEAPATEYVFDVSSDRHTFFAISIFLQEQAVRSWVAGHGKELTEAEQYATGKMALFRAFDEVENLASSGRRFAVGAEDIESLAELLNLE
jgi:hypothetical protein